MDLWHGAQGDWETAQEELAAAGVTDGLPVVPPTPARVEQMLKLHGYAADEMVAKLPPLLGAATWESIAINAVMAGCRPEYLPVVGAAVEALAADEFNLTGIATTTGSAAPLVIVNGPIASEIGMNAGGNALGPGNRANATIGRAVSLVLRNVGGAIPGELDMATLGQPAKYTCCFAENEAASPWPALHVERGFAATASVVTVVGAAGIVEVVDSCSNRPGELAQTFAQSMLIAGSAGSSGLLGGGEPLIIMPPELAMVFDRGGYTKEQAKAAIYERAVMPPDRLSPAVREHLLTLSATAGTGRAVAPLRVAMQPADVMIVVAGGVGVKAAYVPTWGGTTRAVSRQIRRG
ncbi:MAG: hypothetical protein HY525_17570 [Betaproteobacteria bacterium]|nr:hypothetical protein [Betaproteobacteria bacterium]